MAKISQGKDPNQNTRKRTRRDKGKWETALDRNSSRSNSTPSWNRSTVATTVKKSTKNITRKK